MIATAGFAALAGASAGGVAWSLAERARALRVASWVAGAAARARGADPKALALDLLAAAGAAQCAWPPVARLAAALHTPLRPALAGDDPGPAAWLAWKQAAGLAAGLGFGWLAADPAAGAIAGLLGAWLPDLVARDRRARRDERLRRELPDVLDLLVLALEAGLSIDAALAQAADKLKGGALAGAIGRMLEDVRLGARRHDAWDRMASATGSADVIEVVGALVQADRMGVGLTGALRGLAEQTRVRRRQRVEAAAQKAPVKLLIPLACFIFPCIFIVLLGPVFLALAGGGR